MNGKSIFFVKLVKKMLILKYESTLKSILFENQLFPAPKACLTGSYRVPTNISIFVV